MNIDTKVYRKHESPTFGNTLLGAVPLVSEVYLMDNIELMKHYPDKYFDLAVVDPPYGIGFSDYERGGMGQKVKERYTKNEKKKWDNTVPLIEYFTELFRVSQNQIIWGGNYFADLLQPTKGWIYWDKKPNGENLTFSDGELAWTSFNKPLKAFSYGWIGFGMLNSGEKKIHPTQKPVALYEMVLQKYSKPNDLILDTHVGSGSSRIAAYKGGFNFVGFEIDQEYYEKQEKRFNDFKSQLRLF